MSQVKVYAQRALIEAERARMSEAIQGALVAGIGLPAAKCFQRFIGLEAADFVYPADRSERYTIIEISMFEGRSVATKRALLTELVARLSRECDIAPQDIEVTIFETPRANWSIRGMVADDLALDYRVEV